MSQNDGKSHEVERDVPTALHEKHFRQPNAESSNQEKTEKGSVETSYDCPHCELSFKNKLLFDRHYNSHTQILYCWICNRNARLTIKEFNDHLLHHENEILNTNGYLKAVSSLNFERYEKRFDDDSWVWNPFEGTDLNDILNILKISIAIKKHALIFIKVKAWFVTLNNEEENYPKSVWMSLRTFQSSKYDISLKNKLQEIGSRFISNLCDTDNIDGNGSGFVYYAVSNVTITVVKNLQIGCNICSYCSSCSTCLNITSCVKCIFFEKMITLGIVFNPSTTEFCFNECIKMALKNCSLKFELIEQIQNSLLSLKQRVSFLDIEKWSELYPSLQLKIFLLDENDKQIKIHPILLQRKENSEITIHLLAVFSTMNNIAHFLLIQDIEKFMLKLGGKSAIIDKKIGGMHKFCKHCFVFNSKLDHVLQKHELFCYANYQNIRFNEEKRMKHSFDFPKEKTYLKLTKSLEYLTNAPNWYGFLDFETVNENIEDWFDRSKICSKHRVEGLTQCNCPKTLFSDKIESISYFLVIFDFNNQNKIFEKFYLQKSKKDLSCGEHLIYTLKHLAYKLELLNSLNFPIDMTEYQRQCHKEETHCQTCKREFTPDVAKNDIFDQGNTSFELAKIAVKKAAHHLHHKAKNNFHASICGRCNLAIQSRYQHIPIYCHNLSKFDHVFFLKSILRIWPRYKTLGTSENEILAITIPPFCFKDSLRFLNGSLEKNIELAKKSCFSSCVNCNNNSVCKPCEENNYNSLKSTFNSIYNSDLSQVDGKFSKQRFLDNLQKAAFPYSLLSNYDDLLSIKKFPNQDKFFNVMKNKKVEESNYQTAKRYFEKYCNNMVDFLEIYNKLDCYLLHSVWKVQSDILYRNFFVYVENFMTLPSFSLEIAKLSLYEENDNLDTGIELFSEQNKDLYFKCMKNIRGGIVFSKSKFELSSSFEKCMNQSFSNENWDDKSSEMDYESSCDDIVYIDACNLYGYALSNQLPYADYKQISLELIERINSILDMTNESKKKKLLDLLLPEEDEMGFVFDIDILSVPEKLLEFPPFFTSKKITPSDLSPHDLKQFESMQNTPYKGNKIDTMLPITDSFYSYFTHYRLFKCAIKLGVKAKIKSGVSFKQKFLFRDHIYKLGKLRSTSKNPAHKQALKLASNSLYGKLLQSITKYATQRYFFSCDINDDLPSPIPNLIKEKSIFNNFPFILKDIKLLDEDLVFVETERTAGLKPINCPLIAFSILELAKLRNFEFYWKMKEYSPSTKLLYSDTDSFLLRCQQSWYKDIQNMKEYFDFSEFPPHVLSSLNITDEYIKSRSGILGTYKSEISKDNILVGFISLQKKSYCLLLLKAKENQNGEQIFSLVDNPTAKRLDISQLDFKQYINALTENKICTQSRWKFQQKKKNIHISHQTFISLSSFDPSNYTSKCGLHNVFISNLSHTHYLCTICKNGNYASNLITLKKNLDTMLRGEFYFEGGNIFMIKK